MAFSRILEWVAFPFSRDLPNPGIKPRSPALQADSLPAESQGKPKNTGVGCLSLLQWIFPTQESNGVSCIAGGFYLNQIPYEYTVEVTNRFRGVDLIDRVPEELWMEVCDIVQKVVIKTILKKKKCKKAKCCLRRPYNELRK